MGSAIVIGGTRGLGQELAKLAVRAELKTVIIGRSAADQYAAEPRELRAVYRWPLDLAARGASAEESFRAPPFMREVAGEGPCYVFWTAGLGQQTPVRGLPSLDIERLVDVHLTGPIKLIKDLHRLLQERRTPYHLVAVSSTSASRVRDGEEAYCAAKAGKSHFVRQWARVMANAHPESRATLVHPGGMNTGFWHGEMRTAARTFMNPAEVATKIWELSIGQTSRYREYTIERGKSGQLGAVIPGIQTPEAPFSDEMP